MTERGDRGRRGKNGDRAERPPRRTAPAAESEGSDGVTPQEVRGAVEDDDGPVGEVGRVGDPRDAVVGAVDAPAPPKTLAAQPLVQLIGAHRLVAMERRGDTSLVGDVVRVTALAARAMTSGQAYGVVQKEDRRVQAGRSQRHPPTAELGGADDPEVAAVVTNDLLVIVDQTPPIAHEQPTFGDRVTVPERIDSIPPWVRHP